MNENLLKQYLTIYTKWFKENESQAISEQNERMAIAECAQGYTKERLLNMSKEDFFDYISPLWAMAMWGNKHYQVDNIIEANGMELLREQFANLIYGGAPIEKRWDEFRSKIKGVGPAIMSELLCKTYPQEFLLWNKKTYNGFFLLEIPSIPRYEARINGKMYSTLSEIGRNIVVNAEKYGAKEVFDLLTLNSFIWQELQVSGENKSTPSIEEKLIPSNTKDAQFIHNDIRDKLAEIGRCLGFSAEVEKKVADGAVVDATWEVTIGNMGRVIYVFEVQTAGSIDSLILNLIRANNNPAVQGVVAVTDKKQIEKIKKEIASIKGINGEIKFWDYTEVLRVHESLQYVNESINNLGLVPLGL